MYHLNFEGALFAASFAGRVPVTCVLGVIGISDVFDLTPLRDPRFPAAAAGVHHTRSVPPSLQLPRDRGTFLLLAGSAAPAGRSWRRM